MNFVVMTDTVINPANKQTIDEMAKLARKSFRENLRGEWEWIILDSDFSKSFTPNNGSYDTGEYVADNLHFYDAFNRIHEIWRGGHNILFVSPDQLCVKQCHIFGEFDCFAMFWPTTAVNDYGFPAYLNSGITYFPQNMSDNVWNIGFKLWRNNDPQTWDRSQVIYNHMFYAQGVPVTSVLRNDLHWSDWTNNEIEKEEACVIHYHGSKGLVNTLATMQDDWSTLCV